MHRTSRILALWLLAWLASFAAAAPRPAVSEATLRYGIYFRDARVGSMTVRIAPTEHRGRPAVRLEAETRLRLTLLGNAVEQDMAMAYLLDAAGRPVFSTHTLRSAGREVQIRARYERQQVVCHARTGDEETTRTIPIPKGVTLIGDPQLAPALREPALRVGSKTTFHFFEPLTMTIQKGETEVVKAETRRVDDRPVRAFLLRTRTSLTGESETWVAADGRLLEDSNRLGLRMVREDLLAEPPSGAYTPPRDFAVATAVKTETKLQRPRSVQRLRVRIGGIPDASFVLSDARQRVTERTEESGRITAVYAIEARELPARALPAARPEAGAPPPPELADAPYLALSDPAIRKQAADLAAGGTDRAVIARRVRAWVRGHIRRIANIGAPRSAPEILRSREGVCRDHAVLFTAVARAAGVPTRLCAGLVYFDDGFYYHAWVECHLTDGPDGWYPFDPTLDDDFVDATHIKFAQGDPTEMFAAARIVGELKAELLDWREIPPGR